MKRLLVLWGLCICFLWLFTVAQTTRDNTTRSTTSRSMTSRMASRMVGGVTTYDTFVAAITVTTNEDSLGPYAYSDVDSVYGDMWHAYVSPKSNTQNVPPDSTFFRFRIDTGGGYHMFNSSQQSFGLMFIDFSVLHNFSNATVLSAELSIYSRSNYADNPADTVYCVPMDHLAKDRPIECLRGTDPATTHWSTDGNEFCLRTGSPDTWSGGDVDTWDGFADVTRFHPSDLPRKSCGLWPGTNERISFDVTKFAQYAALGDTINGFWMIGTTSRDDGPAAQAYNFCSHEWQDGQYTPVLTVKYSTEPYDGLWGADQRWVATIIADDGRGEVYDYYWPACRDSNVDLTLAVNINNMNGGWALTIDEINEMIGEGLKIAQHGNTNCNDLVSYNCDEPCDLDGDDIQDELTGGSLLAYFSKDCYSGGAVEDTLKALHDQLLIEIDRDTMVNWPDHDLDIEASEIKTLTYPSHDHSDTLIQDVVCQGYICARNSGESGSGTESCFATSAQSIFGEYDGWSLYRLRLTGTLNYFYGASRDHTYDEVKSAIESRMANKEIIYRRRILIHPALHNELPDSCLRHFIGAVRELGGEFRSFQEIGEAIRANHDSVTTVTDDYSSDYEGDLIWR